MRQNGSKTQFSKSDSQPVRMLKQVFFARFETVVTPFGPWKIQNCLENGPFWDKKWHFGIFRGPKRVPTGSKLAKNTCLSITNGPRSLLKKCVFDAFLTHFLSQSSSFSRHFGIFHDPKRVTTTGSKRAKNTCLSIPSLRTTLKKIFFHPGYPGGPTVGPNRVGRAALRLHEVTTGTGVYPSRWAMLRLGNHKKWGAAGARCPRNSVLCHVAQDTARSWFWACLTQMAHI